MAINATSSNAVLKTGKPATPHKPAARELPARLIGAIFVFAGPIDALSGKRVSRDFRKGFDFWAITERTLDLEKVSVLNLARLFDESIEGFPRVTALKINLNFGAFLFSRMNLAPNLDAMIERIPKICPAISELSIADDQQYGQVLVAGIARSLRCVKITLPENQQPLRSELVKLCPPELTQFKVAGVEELSLSTVISCRKLTSLEAENLKDGSLVSIASKCHTKQINLKELHLSWKSKPTPTAVGFNLLKSCEKLKHLSLKFFSAQLHNSVTAKTMIGLVEDLPELESFSLEVEAGVFDNASLAVALAKKCPKLNVKLTIREPVRAPQAERIDWIAFKQKFLAS